MMTVTYFMHKHTAFKIHSYTCSIDKYSSIIYEVTVLHIIINLKYTSYVSF